MPVHVALVHSDPQFLTATEQGLQSVGFVITAFGDFMQAWSHVTRGNFDVLVAQAGAPPGQPCGVALATAGIFNNPRLEAVLLATQHEVEYAESVADVLNAAVTARILVDYLVWRFAPSARAACSNAA